MDIMYAIDCAVLRFLNRVVACGPLDWLMATVTEPRNWFPVLVVFAAWIWWRKGWRWLSVILVAAVIVAFTDATVHRVLKPLFSRVRPCNALDWVRTPSGGSSGLSFPSAHAANAFAAATFLSLRLRPLTVPLMAIATLVGLSRIYLGLHYPSDVLAGACFGAGTAIIVARFVPGPGR